MRKDEEIEMLWEKLRLLEKPVDATRDPAGRCLDPRCGAVKGHSPFCSHAPIEQVREAMLANYYQVIREQQSARKAWAQVTFWQGKHALVRHELAVVRRKLKRITDELKEKSDERS